MENDFIYFVDLDDHLVCNNLIKTNQIFTPYIAHYFTYKQSIQFTLSTQMIY